MKWVGWFFMIVLAMAMHKIVADFLTGFTCGVIYG